MNAPTQEMRQLPLYQCHKKVWALKIAAIVFAPMPKFSAATCKGSFALGSACGNCERCAWEREHPNGQGAIIRPADVRFADFDVDAQYLAKHKPEVGGYYVQYGDGYKSFSPAKAFEEGYTLIQ